MIVSLRSRCMVCYRLGEGQGVASGIGHRGSMKGKVGMRKNCPCLGGTSTRPPHSFYLLCHNER
jgi:hypothetical protein